MWQKLVWLGLFLVLSSGSRLSLQEELHNDEIEEIKFKTFDQPLIVPFADPSTYRLPNDSIPLSYTLRLQTDIDQGIFEFEGNVKIHIKIVEPTSEITLHYRQINMTKIQLLDVGTQDYIRDLEFYTIESHEFLKINLTTQSQVDDEILLDIDYEGLLRLDGGGFYAAYYDVNGTRFWYGTTQFEVTDARHAMPCYDEPGIRAPIQLTIDHSPNYEAVANTPVDRHETSGSYQRTVFEPTPRMQTYLLAFLVSPFHYVSNNDSRVEQRIYAKPSSIANGEADFGITVVKPILEKLEEHLKVDFPIRKMDHAAITQFNFGAMENFGLITYIERGILYNPNTPWSSQESSQMSIIRLIAHEFVHQWFGKLNYIVLGYGRVSYCHDKKLNIYLGNIVSPQWWTYTWLNEGFATLFQSYISSLTYPNLNFINDFVTSALPRAFSNDIGSSWSMNHYTEIPAELWSKFGAIGYQKSGCVLRMFQESLTVSSFAKGLNYYLTDNYMQAVTPQKLHAGLQRAFNEDFPGNGIDIDMLMGMWENQPGYPLLSVEVSGSNLKFTQRRYPESNGEIYAIPITFANRVNNDFNVKTPKTWMTTETMYVAMSAANYNSGDWIVFNLQQVGYYKVDYSTELWHAIIKQLTEDFQLIHPINRAILMDEIFMAWKELDRVTAADVLESLTYFSLEEEYLTWNRADKIFTDFNNRLKGSHAYKPFRKFIQDITKSHVERLGFEAIEGEPSAITNLRSFVKKWSCTALSIDCLNHEYQKWLNFFTTGISGASFDYCFALTNLATETFDEIITGISTNTSYPSRNNYLRYLGCNQNEKRLWNLLSAAINTTNVFTTQERLTIIRSVFQAGHVGIWAFFHFVDVYFAEIYMISPTEFINTILEVATYVTTECTINTLALLLSHAVEHDIMTIEERARVRVVFGSGAIAWNKKNYELVEEWLNSYKSPEEVTTVAPTPSPSTNAQETTTQAGAKSPMNSFTILITCIAMVFIARRT